MTNLDNIRQMNSEELAKVLLNAVEEICRSCVYDSKCQGNENYVCIDGVKAWLEQEVTPILTDDEKVILRNIDKAQFSDIGRTIYGELRLIKVVRCHGTLNDGEVTIDHTKEPIFYDFNWCNLFDFIKPGKTYEISKLLGEEDLVGKEGICEYCGAKGTYQYDPYDIEILDKEEIVCLCDKCYQNRAEEI